MSLTLLSTLQKDQLIQLFASIDYVLTDCDGVLWLEDQPLHGAAAALELLRKMGKRIFYVTNNSTKTRDEFVIKCNKMGFPASKDDILSTAYLTACYLVDKKFNKKVYVVGSKGITQELDAVGIRHTDAGPDELTVNVAEFVQNFKRDPEVGAVVVGFDQHFNYLKMLKAASYLKNPDCLFIGTNTDQQFPMNTDLVVPGTGSILAGIEVCSNRKAVIMGKPSEYVGDIIIKPHQVDPKRVLMIGDRGNTDILLGTRCGFRTLLVLTGVTNLQQAEEWKKSNDKELQSWVADFYLKFLGDLLDLFPCEVAHYGIVKTGLNID